MNNLKIATWNLEDKNFRFKKNKIRMQIINGLLEEDVDIIALQNVDRKMLTSLDKELANTNYELDAKTGNMDNVADMVGKKNTLIYKDKFMNIGDKVATDGLIMNVNYLKDKKDCSNYLYLLNSNIEKIDENFVLLREVVSYAKSNKRPEESMLIVGNININTDNLFVFNRAILRPNSLTHRISNNNEYMFFDNKHNMFSHRECEAPLGMHKPMVLTIMK